MNVPHEHRSRFAWPWGTTALVLVMFYVFSMEVHAMNWGIIDTLMDDLAFSWKAFQAHPIDNLPRLISHQFMHANQSHIVGNVVFFLIFAPAVEREMGHFMFVFLYLMWGALAACIQGFFSPLVDGGIGASGAISGACGAYFVLFPLRTPKSAITLFLGRIISKIPAFFWIGLWFLSELKGGWLNIMPVMLPGRMDNVGHWAHVGGFAVGAICAAPFVWTRQEASADRSLRK